MKRGGPLRRLTPLRRRRRGVPTAVRLAVLERDRRCVLAPGGRLVKAGRVVGGNCAGVTDPHHVLPRGRGGPDTAANLVALCRVHHDWVHAHPAIARQLGLLR